MFINILICKVPFCGNRKVNNNSFCGPHKWEREKYKVKSYKEVLPIWAAKRCFTHGLLRYSQISILKSGQKVCKLCRNLKYDPIKQKKYNGNYKIRQTNWRLRKRYQIDFEEYERILANQNNCCAICKISIQEYRAKRNNNVNFAIDHCHITMQIRGVLCHKCNMGLGYFNDNSKIITQALCYLEYFKPTR